MGDEFDQQAEKAIPAEVRMVSGCHDTQTSADVSNVSSFDLPDPAGRAGGACTSALLKVLYDEHQAPSETPSYIDVFLRMREVLSDMGFKQIPQLSSSRRLDVHRPFAVSDSKMGEGTRRAVLIGINYVGQKGELSGCHNDVHNIKEYLMDVHGFQEENMTVLIDDGCHRLPTKNNIMSALHDLVNHSQSGDTAFLHYSGHGGRVKDVSGDEADGYDETLIPLDYRDAGHILDDELYEHLVCAMPRGSLLTCLMDCCHSGTVLDLPYNFLADGEHDEMEPALDFKFEQLASWVKSAMGRAGIHGLSDLIDKGKQRELRKVMTRDVKDKVKGKIMGKLGLG